MKEIDKIALIHIREGKILCARSKGKSKFYLPGGKRDEGETDEQTLQRECKEELSVTILQDSIEYVGTFVAQSDGKADGVMVKMTCYSAEFDDDIRVNNEIEEVSWLNFDDCEKLSVAGKLIFNYLKEIKAIA